MPAFTDHYKHSRQQRDSSSSSLSSTPAPAPAPGQGPTGIAGAAGGVFTSSRPRIYPREYSSSSTRNPKSPHLSSTTSPLLSALPNPSDIFSKSIPFPSFLSSSSPSSGAPNSLGSASGGVGLSSGTSPPPSAPASYSSGGGFSAPRQARGYPGFEQPYSSYDGSTGSGGGYYNPSQRYPHGSPQTVSGHGGGGTQPQLHPGDGSFACELAIIDEPGVSGGGARATAAGAVGGENVVCLGWNGGLDVWRIGRGVVEQVGKLEGLKGAVKSAKILPNPPSNDPFAAHRPLVCVTLHAPIIRESDRPPAIMLEAESPYSTSPPSRPDSASDTSLNQTDIASEWQTTVEVWGLSSKTRLATLFTSPPISSDAGFGISTPPHVWGGLRVQVSGSRIVVGVGDSGELYIFGIERVSGKKKNQRETAEWRCLEKVWTAVQYPSNPNGSFSSEGGHGIMDPKLSGLANMSNGTPVFSLSDRWLAYCPASTGSFSAGGEVKVPFNSQSVTSQAPPTQPSISAAVSLEDEAFLNRVAREVTQEVIRGAKWAADTGYKKFQSYWHGGHNGSPPAMNPYSPPMAMPQSTHPQPSGLSQQLRQMQQIGGTSQYPQFYSGQAANEPRLVSIVDLANMTNAQYQTTPIATFLPPAGVSFLSFAPGGLALLTASSKGDLLFVWDLLKVVHHPPGNGSLGHQRTSSASGIQEGKSSASATGNIGDTLGKHIRQIARFTRMTVATIVDVDWSSPRGEKLAVVTERGTAHFYDLPSGALQWPPAPRPPPSSAAVNNSQTTARDAAVSKAVNLFNSSTQPLLTAARKRRSRSSSVGSPSGGMFASPSRRNGGGVTASGSGSSPNDPPTGWNKISLPTSSSSVCPGCIRFLAGKERGYVAVLNGGLLRIYELRPGGSGKKGSKIGGVANGNWWEYDLPLLPAGPEHHEDASESKAAGFWTMRGHGNRNDEDDRGTAYWKEPLAWAEIETNSVFTPWHQEKRVKVFVYTPAEPRVDTPVFHEAMTIPDVYEPAPSAPDLLSPNHLQWQVEEPAPAPERRKKKGKKGKTPPPSESPSPPLLDFSDVSPSPTPTPPQKTTSHHIEQGGSPAKQQDWVFGLPLEAERIFLSNAGGRGDVEFGGEGQDALAKAMADGLSLAEVEEIRAQRSREGFFEEDAEVLYV